MKLTVEARQLTGKKVKLLRKKGLVPAVIYGKHLDEAITISINKIQLVKILQEAGRSTPVQLSGDIDQLVLFHDVQLDPITDHVKHVDFLAVNKDEKVEAEVPLELIGESMVETDNLGRIQLLKRTLQVEALPLDLPSSIEIDITKLEEVGAILFVKDLELGDKIEILDDLELAIASAVAFREEVEEEEETLETEGVEGEEGTGEGEEGSEESSSEEEKSE